MRSDNIFTARLYLIFGTFVLISLVLLVNAKVPSIPWIIGFGFASMPIFVLVKAFESIYGILAVMSSADIMQYEIPYRLILRFFGLLPVFQLLKSSMHGSML